MGICLFTGICSTLVQSTPAHSLLQLNIPPVLQRNKRHNLIHWEIDHRFYILKDTQQKVNSGDLEVSGSSDVLTLSLGNPEHPGRTRGLGAQVTWKEGLNTYRASRKREFNQADMTAFAEEIQRRCYTNMREEMKEEMKEDLRQEMEEIRQQMKDEIKQQMKEQLSEQCIDQDASMPESASNEVAKSMHCKALIPNKLLAKVGPEFRAINERVMREPHDKTEFILEIKEGVLLPQSMLINIGFNDLTDLAKQDILDVSIISIWVIYLKRLVTDLGREADIGFLDPSRISSSLFNSAENEAASSYLLESLNNMQDKKFILGPYFQSKHWALFIFVMRENMVYVIDSLALKEPSYDIMLPFKGGVHKEGSTECEWKYIKSPRQQGNKVCGFYVMKHMQDLVTTQFDVFPNCDLPTEKYTPTQLHAITRQMVCIFLGQFLNY